MKLVNSLLATTALMAIGITSATAQESPENSGADTRTLGTVTVTAQKREQNAQDVPISISAFSGDTLDALGIEETEELGQFLPGLEISTSSGEGSQLIVFLRGAGLNDFNTNNAGPVAIYSDEVYISSPALTAFQFFDTERVEVLKGPQGTLYGRNTTGGAIKFIANKPTDSFTGYVNGSYAEYDTTSLTGALSGPLNDRVKARIAASKVDSDGFGKNLVDGSDTNGVDTFAWRGIVDFDATESVSIRANLHGAQVNSPGTSFNHLGIGPGGTDALGYAGTGDPYRGEYNRIGNVDLSSIGGYLEANVDLGSVTLTSVTAYDEVDRDLFEETDASPLDLLAVSYGVESETITQEIRAAGSTEKLDWLVGGFYLTEELDQDQTTDVFRELRAFTGGLSDPGGTITGAPILFARVLNAQETETFALFGQASYDLTDRLTATAGLRYTAEERTFSAVGQLEDEAAFGPAPLVLYDFQGLNIDDDAVSWRLALDYAATDDVLIYGSVARGFKSGGFNGGFLSLNAADSFIQVQPYEPEFLTSYEIGVKSDLLDDKLRLNGALFFSDFEDLQVFTLINTGTLPVQILDNAGSAEVLGLEFDATLFPVDGLTLSLSAAFLDSELQEVAGGGGNFDGNKIANTPDTSISTLARYEFDIGEAGAMFVQGSAAYKSDLFFSTENNPIVAQDAYTLFNARIGWTAPNGNFGVAVFGKNLGDEAYLTNVTDLTDFGFYGRTFGQPQTFGIELTAEF